MFTSILKNLKTFCRAATNYKWCSTNSNNKLLAYKKGKRRLFRYRKDFKWYSTATFKPLQYKYGSPERKALEDAIQEVSSIDTAVPIVIGVEQIISGDEQKQMMPHNLSRPLIKFCYCNRQQIQSAIKVGWRAKEPWGKLPPSERVNIWNKCINILEKEERHKLNAAMLVGQAKTYLEAEDDSYHLLKNMRECAQFYTKLSQLKLTSMVPERSQPTLQLRPLEGFIAAITPFNLVSTAVSYVFSPILMGNCVLWKPSDNAILSSYIVYQAMLKAGLPQGVINFLPTNATLFVDTISQSPFLSGINFCGCVHNFREIWHEVSVNIRKFKSIPRLIGECGSKNFHFVHETANVETVADATVEAAFLYSGQKHNACSRLYVPDSLWSELNCALQSKINSMTIGDPCDFSVYTSAVINKTAFDRIVSYIKYAKESPNVDIVCGGDSCKTLGYFIEPTVMLCKDALDPLLTDDIMGPILSVYVYKNHSMNKTLDLIANTSIYCYSGSIFANDDKIICEALKRLKTAASNLYINGKCTGSIMGYSPFGGMRHSGTNDQITTPYGLLRWSSPQLIEESLAKGSSSCQSTSPWG